MIGQGPFPTVKIAADVVAHGRELEKRWWAKRRRVLLRTGGYSLKVFLRQRVRTGKATSTHSGYPIGKTQRLKANSRFEVNEHTGTLDVGFTDFPSRVADPLGGKTVPSVLLHGGRERLHLPARVIDVRNTTKDGQPRRDDSGRFLANDTRQVMIAPRSVIATYLPRPALLPDAQSDTERKLRENIRDVPL